MKYIVFLIMLNTIQLYTCNGIGRGEHAKRLHEKRKPKRSSTGLVQGYRVPGKRNSNGARVVTNWY